MKKFMRPAGITMLAGSWSPAIPGGWRRSTAGRPTILDPVLPDTEAKEILVARHRAHNAAYRMPADFTDGQRARLNRSPWLKSLDVPSLSEATSYGPSLIYPSGRTPKLLGLSDDEAVNRIEEWTRLLAR
jgi:hypothetical protein